jgi:hypothetical protein
VATVDEIERFPQPAGNTVVLKSSEMCTGPHHLIGSGEPSLHCRDTRAANECHEAREYSDKGQCIIPIGSSRILPDANSRWEPSARQSRWRVRRDTAVRHMFPKLNESGIFSALGSHDRCFGPRSFSRESSSEFRRTRVRISAWLTSRTE